LRFIELGMNEEAKKWLKHSLKTSSKMPDEKQRQEQLQQLNIHGDDFPESRLWLAMSKLKSIMRESKAETLSSSQNKQLESELEVIAAVRSEESERLPEYWDQQRQLLLGEYFFRRHQWDAAKACFASYQTPPFQVWQHRVVALLKTL
jgi:hypothetical protein